MTIMCRLCATPSLGTVFLSIRRRRRTSRWLLRIQHLIVHALDRGYRHSRTRPVIVDRVAPAACQYLN